MKDVEIVPLHDMYKEKSRSPTKRRCRVRGLSIAEGPSIETCDSSQLQWDDSSWSHRKRRQAPIHEEESVVPSSTKSVAATPAKRYRLSPSSANKRLLRRCTLPANNSKAGEICKRLRNAMIQDTKERRILFDMSKPPTLAPTETTRKSLLSPYVLYRFLRVRMAAGVARSSFTLLHKLLRQGYGEAKSVLNQMDESLSHGELMTELLAVRDRLATLWCVYVHFLLEVGKLGILPAKKQQLGRLEGGFKATTYHDVVAFAVSALWNVRNCPLVGNHAAITVCLGRLMMTSLAIETTKVENDSIEVTRSKVTERIRMSVAVCWEAVDWTRADQTILKGLSLNKLTTNQVTEYFAVIDLPGKKVHNEKRLNPQTLQGEFKSTLKLPLFLREQGAVMSNASFLFDDRNAKRTVCAELNRWSRSEEQLAKYPNRTMTLSPSVHTEPVSCMEEQLPLFQIVDMTPAAMDLFSSKEGDGALLIWKW